MKIRLGHLLGASAALLLSAPLFADSLGVNVYSLTVSLPAGVSKLTNSFTGNVTLSDNKASSIQFFDATTATLTNPSFIDLFPDGDIHANGTLTFSGGALTGGNLTVTSTVSADTLDLTFGGGSLSTGTLLGDPDFALDASISGATLTTTGGDFGFVNLSNFLPIDGNGSASLGGLKVLFGKSYDSTFTAALTVGGSGTPASAVPLPSAASMGFSALALGGLFYGCKRRKLLSV